MIPVTTLAGRRVAVFGLGASGNATALALAAGGAEVAAWDDGPAAREAAAKAGVPLADLNGTDWARFSALVLAPGVPLTHPEPHWTVGKARAAGIEVIGDVELFFRERAAHCPAAPVVAITGTNGKSTTTALTAHLLREDGRDVQMGGNIGRALLTLEPPRPDRIYVLELSSFQIDLTTDAHLKPTIGVLTNLTPDHLDRHGPGNDTALAMRNYAAVKRRMVAGSEHALVGVDDAFCLAIARDLQQSSPAHVVTPVSVAALARHDGLRLPGIEASDGRVLVREGGRTEAEIMLGSLAGIETLRGLHNAQNAAFAGGAAHRLGVAPHRIAAALRTYPGLPHRMEQVGTIATPTGRILIVNDSKATNADSTDKALAAFPRDIFWILGGKPKEGGITTLERWFPRVTRAYLIGQATEEFAATLEGKVALVRSGTLDVALRQALEDAARSMGPEPVVLLSPACASYDQFKSFEHRGDVFREMVRSLQGVATQ